MKQEIKFKTNNMGIRTNVAYMEEVWKFFKTPKYNYHIHDPGISS